MGELADKRLGDLLPTIDAYRPVALTVAAILALVAVLPAVHTSERQAATFDAFEATPAAASPTPTTVAAPAPGGSDPVVAPTIPTPTTVARSTFTPPASPTPTSSPPTTAAPAPVAPVPTTTPAPAPRPARIVDSGWASATGGAPLDASTVPEGTLPVGARVAQTDKIAFVRLSGSSGVLVLGEDADGRRGNAFDASPVQACQITDASWQGGPDQPLGDAPDWDPDTCVTAQPQADGTWTIAIATFADPYDSRGLALVPTPDAPIDFQVTFAGQAVG